MKKNISNRTALFLVTLFLFVGGAAQNAVCQNQALSRTNEIKSKLAPTDYFQEKARPAFFAKEKSSTESVKSFAAARRQTATTYTRPSRERRLKRYLRRTFGVYAIVGNAASAGVAQLTDSPAEWENNGKGYARRFASAFGRSAIKQTTIYGLDEALKLDSNFYKSGKRNAGDRLKNAVLTTFTARKPNGKRVFGAPRIAATYASSIVATEAWYPSRFSYKDGLRTGTISLGVNVGINILREFFLGK